VSLSIPSVVGPYTNLCCTLTLLKSSVRKSSIGSPAYPRQDNGELRFVDYVGAAQSIVTSSGTTDGGLFEASLNDERFLPFEGAGAISTWQLRLPSELRAFDYGTISDAILHVRYTARDGGQALGDLATANAKSVVSAGGSAALLFALRTDLPTEWAAFVATGTTFSLRLRKEHFPYAAQGASISIDAFELDANVNGHVLRRSPPIGVPGTANGDLATQGYVDLSLPADGSVLRPTNAQVFLIVKYSFA